jgi:hypothetical protein
MGKCALTCKNRPRIRSTSEDIRHGKSWSGVHAIMDLADGPWDGPISVRVRSMGMSMGLPLSARLRVFRSLARVSALRLRESSGCTSSGCSPCVPCTMQKREGVCHHLAPMVCGLPRRSPGVSCSARWPGSAEHARGDGHAWDLARLFVLPRHALATRTRTQRQGTSHVHVVPKSSRAGHHSVPGKWHDC